MMKKITLLFTFLIFSLGYSQTDIAVNGGFESGDFTGWTLFPSGTQAIINNNASVGTYCAQLTNNVPASASVIKNANVGAGTAVGGQDVTITFDARGTTAFGGIAGAELFSEKSGGGTSKTQNLGNLALDSDPNTWKTFTFVTTLGPDVSGGVTLQLVAITGGDVGSLADIFFDNVKITLGAPPAPTCSDGVMNGNETGVDCGGQDCAPCAQDYNITFSVDMTGQTFTQAYVSGSFNGWSGNSNPLTDMGGGIWSVTLPIPEGEHEYKFTYDNWAGQESFSQGDVCTIWSNNFANRLLVVNGADQTLSTPLFSTCAESATNPGPHSVTFNVDMSAYGGTLGLVYINGENFNGQGLGNWCGTCLGAMTDMGSGIWSITLSLEEYSYLFKFTVNGWNDQEMFVNGDPGTTHNGGNVNRYIQVNSDKTYNATWNVPEAGLSTKDFAIAGLNVYPNPTKDSWTVKTKNINISSVQVYDISGKQVQSISPNASEVKIDASKLSKGLYFVTLRTEAGSESLKLIKN